MADAGQFAGAVAALLVFKLPGLIASLARGSKFDHELPFGPGLAVGVVVTWLGWRWVGPGVQFIFYDAVILGVVVVILSVGMLAAGLLLRGLRRPDAETEAQPAAR